jgi:hypothetical protein
MKEGKEIKSEEIFIPSIIKKLLKKMVKIEKEFENAPPLRKERLLKMALSVQKKLDN